MSDQPVHISNECEMCDKPANWAIYAAYEEKYELAPRDVPHVHPRVAHYPGAMSKVCEMHVQVFLMIDQMAAGHTTQYVLKKLADA